MSKKKQKKSKKKKTKTHSLHALLISEELYVGGCIGVLKETLLENLHGIAAKFLLISTFSSLLSSDVRLKVLFYRVAF